MTLPNMLRGEKYERNKEKNIRSYEKNRKYNILYNNLSNLDCFNNINNAIY